MQLFDRIQIPTKRQYTNEGFLVVDARISRTGIQQYYAFEMGLEDREPTDIINVYRPEDEVFNEESMQSFANAVVTDDHPSEMVNADNAKTLAIGFSGDVVYRDGNYVATKLRIIDKDAIAKINDGKVELSNGYTSSIEWTPGIAPNGEAYDAIQRNIKGNHIALVQNGRCGASCKVSDSISHNQPSSSENIMPKVKIDGVDFEVTDQAEQAVTKLLRRLHDAEEKNAELEEKIDELEEEKKKAEDEEEENVQKDKDALQAKLDAALAKIPTPQQLDALIDNRMKTRDAAISVIPDFKWEGKDCETIRKEVVAQLCTDVDTTKVSADYIRARFDAMVADGVKSNDIDDALQQQHSRSTQTNDASADPVAAARKKFADESRNAWKNKGGK